MKALISNRMMSKFEGPGVTNVATVTSNVKISPIATAFKLKMSFDFEVTGHIGYTRTFKIRHNTV